MNALANSQLEELDKFVGQAAGERRVTFARYTGQEDADERKRVADEPPDILLTNFMMLELLMTRQQETDRRVIGNCAGLRFLVLDELHTYRGRQGADVALLVRRVRERIQPERLLCIGTSATMASEGSLDDRSRAVARVVSKLFGIRIAESNVIAETLERITDPAATADSVQPRLGAAIDAGVPPDVSDAALREHPLAVWVETRLGIAFSAGDQWELAFPDVFARGGFDVLLGNPPWERVKLQEQEFFARREPAIAAARNAAERKKLIAALPATNPDLWKEWTRATRIAQGQSHFARQSGRYPLCGKGDVNTYALFAEHNWRVLAPRGCAGFIVPGGIVTDDTTKEYFQALLDRSALGSVHHFENESLVFKGLHHAYRFVLFTIRESRQADLVFYARRAVDLDDRWRHFALTPADFATLNPNTRTCPTFRSQRDADINLASVPPRRRALAGERPRRESVGPEIPEHVSHGQRLRAVPHAGGAGGSRVEAATADRFERDGTRREGDEEVMLPLYEAKDGPPVRPPIRNLRGAERGSGEPGQASRTRRRCPCRSGEGNAAQVLGPRRTKCRRSWMTRGTRRIGCSDGEICCTGAERDPNRHRVHRPESRCRPLVSADDAVCWMRNLWSLSTRTC